MPKVRASSGMIGTTLDPSCLSRTNKAIMRLRKKLGLKQVAKFAKRFDIPVTEEDVKQITQ
jgi:DNA-binding transcriptional regulator YiaG